VSGVARRRVATILMPTIGVEMRGNRRMILGAALALSGCSLITKLDAPNDGPIGADGGEAADAAVVDAETLDAADSGDGDASDAASSSEVDGPAPYYAASFVEQSFPLSSVAMTMTVGEVIPSFIEMENVGGTPWDSTVQIGTTVPRNRTSVFADSTWISPDRPSAVVGTVPPGANYKFLFDLKAPPTPGTYYEHFGLVAGSIWFGDSDQGGPADDDLEVQILVVADAGAK